MSESTPIRITVRYSEAKARLSLLARGVQNRQLVNRQIMQLFDRHVLRQFDTAGTAYPPRGDRWAPLNAKYLEYKLKKRRSPQPLLWSGHLRATYARGGFHTNDQVGIRSDAEYAPYHETGNPRLPQRSVLPTDEQAIEYAVKVYDNYLVKLANGRAANAG